MTDNTPFAMDIPFEFRAVLAEVNQVLNLNSHDGAVAAGGAIRDWALKQKPRDFDIWIPNNLSMSKAIKRLAASFTAYDIAPLPISDPRHEEYDRDVGDIAYVLDGKPIGFEVGSARPAAAPLQFIALNNFGTVKDIVQRFDFGINMAGFSVNGAYVDWRCLRDFQEKTFTLYNLTGRRDLDNSVNRWYSRFRDRFPDYKLVDARAPLIALDRGQEHLDFDFDFEGE